jgi:peroxiredoxin
MDEFQTPIVGGPAPDFVCATSDGKTVSLSDLLRRGMLVMVFYRGHW